MSIIDTALIFATAAHGAVGQRRKYTDEDYIVHPIRVANIVRSYDGSVEQIAAAYLHDVLEDTLVEHYMICDVFGSKVAKLVLELTDISKPSDGNRATRKAIDREHFINASEEAQFVKCADIIDNSSDLAVNDPSFYKVYRDEVILLLDGMDKVKSEPIHAKACASI